MNFFAVFILTSFFPSVWDAHWITILALIKIHQLDLSDYSIEFFVYFHAIQLAIECVQCNILRKKTEFGVLVQFSKKSMEGGSRSFGILHFRQIAIFYWQKKWNAKMYRLAMIQTSFYSQINKPTVDTSNVMLHCRQMLHRNWIRVIRDRKLALNQAKKQTNCSRWIELYESFQRIIWFVLWFFSSFFHLYYYLPLQKNEPIFFLVNNNLVLWLSI